MQPQAKADSEKLQSTTIEGFLLDVDYLNKNERSIIRLTVRGYDGNSYEIFDEEFKPYFCFVPGMEMSTEEMQKIFVNDVKSRIKAEKIEREQRSLFGESVNCYKIFVSNAAHVPKLSEVFSRHGRCYENDIPFTKRYVIDNNITQLSRVLFEIKNDNNTLVLKGSKPAALSATAPNLNILCFDIEVYNPLAIPRPELDPIIMISYYYLANGKNGSGVITYKQIDEKFVTVAKDEIGMLQEFTNLVNSLDIDVLTGYNSANFDMRYLIERAKALKFDFNLSRFEGNTSIEHHGLVDKVKIAGRVHVDMYLVVKFIAVVGSAEYILKLNSYTLKNVYEAIAKEKKVMIDKNAIHILWNGSMEEKRNLAVYNLNDSEALYKVYSTLIPTMIELSRITGNILSDVCVSTTGQLVEFMLMKHAHMFDELIPNKPDESEIRSRLLNPIEGAYVKTPDPGIYGNIACFDFRGLYPSLIISYNMDPSSICQDCKEYYESPIGTRFSKTRRSIMPTILKRLVDERASVKALYKKDKSNIYWGARSQALKITANAFYGYLGYARSRWYSRDCAASVTAYGRQYIQKAINEAESNGFKVIYGDSVMKGVPILVKRREVLMVIKIENVLVNDYVLTESGWTVVKRIIKKFVDKRFYRIETYDGVVEVTEDHSLINKNFEPVKPGILKVGDELGWIDYKNLLPNKTTRVNAFISWLLGYFVADGTAGDYRKSCNKTIVHFDSQNIKLLKKAQKVLKFIGFESRIYKFKSGMTAGGMVYRLLIKNPIRSGALTYFLNTCYNEEHKKVIPTMILNSSKRSMKAFLEGYLDGDGSNKNKEKIWEATDTALVIFGIHILYKRLGLRSRYFSYHGQRGRKRYLRTIRIIRDKKDKRIHYNHAIRRIQNLGAQKMEVYDLETQNHHFSAGGVLLHNTDSVILLLGDNTKEHALTFLKKFNESLPENMEFELEDFYKRGVFVGKKVQNAKERGAKKKYALITEDGRIKIRGFELVRRDWSRIARDTQKRVLEIILQEGDAKKAVDLVNNVVKRLREGKVPLSELAISTQLRKLTKNYDAKSPELGAAQKAIQQGLKRSDEIEHSVISYVITKHGNSISDKAVLEEFAKDYDADYYINNQVIPATMRILKELNFNEDELKGSGKQSKLL